MSASTEKVTKLNGLIERLRCGVANESDANHLAAEFEDFRDSLDSPPEQTTTDPLPGMRPASAAHIKLVGAVLVCLEKGIEPASIRRFVEEEPPQPCLVARKHDAGSSRRRRVLGGETMSEGGPLMSEFRVEYGNGRVSATHGSLEEARTAKRIEFMWSGRIGEIQERVGDEWVRTDDQRLQDHAEAKLAEETRRADQLQQQLEEATRALIELIGLRRWLEDNAGRIPDERADAYRIVKGSSHWGRAERFLATLHTQDGTEGSSDGD